MSQSGARIFATWAQQYRARGLEPRPITPGTKACHVRGWQQADDAIAPGELERWLEAYPNHGIGLRMGTQLPDGTRLGALDIDRDDYVAVARTLLRYPVCGRFGQKGIAFFVRVQADLPNHPTFRIGGTKGTKSDQVGELLFTNTLIVIPPTFHPDTGNPYTWVRNSILDVDFDQLPLIGD